MNRPTFSLLNRGASAALLSMAAWTNGPLYAQNAEPPARLGSPIVVGTPKIQAKQAQANAALLTMNQAMKVALETNPELAAFRQSRGVAAAKVVIARTYPFNPTLEFQAQGVNAPAGERVTNHVDTTVILAIPVELRHQGSYRKQEAGATVTRTEWEIANQENLLAVRVGRAFANALYRQEKLKLIEETIRLDQQVSQNVKRLVEQGKLRSSDQILTDADIDDTRVALSGARIQLAAAEAELRRSMGVLRPAGTVTGSLETPPSSLTEKSAIELAMNRRPDLQVHHAALEEAEARLKFSRADRWGSPTIGATYNRNETSINFIGGQIALPIPILNTGRGLIQQREAEYEQALLELKQTEVGIQQDVASALDRFEKASAAVATYQKEILPNVQRSTQAMEQLFQQGDPGVDVLRLIDMRRKLLKARDGALDALVEVAQARADLAAAVGDPSVFDAAPVAPAVSTRKSR